MDLGDLEDYLRTAQVIDSAKRERGEVGGGHQHKQVLVLDGGLGAVAKLSEVPAGHDPASAARQVENEVGAWIMICELGWNDLVPVTTLRVVESMFTDQHVVASSRARYASLSASSATWGTVNERR